MPQHAYTIANQGGASFRADINAVLAAIVAANSGATAPAPTFAYMFWADTTSGWLKQRNAANSAWIELWRLSDMALKDTTFALINGADGTKKVVMQLAGIAAGQTRTLTVPDADITVAGTNVAQRFSAPQRTERLVDNDGSFDLNASQEFTCTPTAAIVLTFTNIPAAPAVQKGTVTLVNTANYAISLAATTKSTSGLAAMLSVTGTYKVAYESDGTNVSISCAGAMS